MTKRQVVTAFWDDDAQVWVAPGEDIPGLVVEARRFDELRALVEDLAPELIEANSPWISSAAIELTVVPEPLLDEPAS